MQTIPVAIIGAGPVGLAAAAHLLQRQTGFVLIEAGGKVASSMRDFAHVRLFSPWRYDIDEAVRRHLESNSTAARALGPLAAVTLMERDPDPRFVLRIAAAFAATASVVFHRGVRRLPHFAS